MPKKYVQTRKKMYDAHFDYFWIMFSMMTCVCRNTFVQCFFFFDVTCCSVHNKMFWLEICLFPFCCTKRMFHLCPCKNNFLVSGYSFFFCCVPCLVPTKKKIACACVVAISFQYMVCFLKNYEPSISRCSAFCKCESITYIIFTYAITCATKNSRRIFRYFDKTNAV